MAEMSDLLSSGDVCSVSDSTNIIMRKRVSGEYTFYEWYCKDSGCSLALGRTKAGGLYPRRTRKATGCQMDKWEGSHNKTETEEAVPF